MKKYIIFDFDNTIVDSLDYWYQVMDIETFEHFGIPTIEDFRIQRRGMGNKEIAELFVRLAGVKESIDAVMNFWYSRMKIYYTEKVELIQGVRDWLKYDTRSKKYNRTICDDRKKLFRKFYWNRAFTSRFDKQLRLRWCKNP